MSTGRRKKIYGKAYPISEKEAKSYSRASRSYKSNPIGVTRMSSVNGRGAYQRSAREVAAGKSPEARLSRARTVIRNGSNMAGIIRKKPSGGRKPVSLIRKSTSSKLKKNRSKTKVPGTSYYKTSTGRYQNAKGKFVKASKVSALRKNARKKSLKKNASVGASKSYASGWDAMERSKRAKKAAATRKRNKKRAATGTAAPVKRRKKRTSTATAPVRKTRKRKSAPAAKRKIRKSSPAATRTKRKGSASVARKKNSARQKRSGRRVAAYMAALRAGKTQTSAKKSALKKVPLAQGDSFKGTVKVGTVSKGKPRTVRGTKYVANKRKRKASTKRRRKAVSATTKRRRRAAAAKRRPVAAKRRRAATSKRVAKSRRVSRKRRSTAAPVRRRRKSVGRRKTMRRNGRRKTVRRTYRRNASGWMQTFKDVLVTGAFITVGFLSHKVITNLVCDPIFDLFKKKEGEEATKGTEFQIAQWKKPIVGAGVLLIGIPVLTLALKKNQKRAVELGGGMVASWLHSILVSASLHSGETKFIEAVGEVPMRSDWTGRKWPYTNSRAASLAGSRRRRRSVSGLGASGQHLRSIGPRYTPVSRLGQYQQAAAGSYSQAAAGFQQAAAGMGEYFTPMNATGEYFAPASTQGVGAYEAAGELAMPRNNQVIQDGIRPDANLDREMSIMEAAAGLRGGVGSYFEGGPNGQIENVGTQSQWIPNGEVWAGELAVNAGQQTSELSAGILNVPGGNGILSGG